MSAQIHALLDEERAREPAIAPCAAMPLVTAEQCAAVDETGQHLDIEPIKSVEAEHPWLLPLYVLTAVASTLVSIVWPTLRHLS